jgi:LPXTG-motif cell wall-anchored protein
LTPLVLADAWNKKTIVTTSGPMEIPGGKVLPAGKYVFKLMDSPSNRHIVQIFNEEQNQVMATILALPNYRLKPTDESTFGLWETPAGRPAALRSWFYPGDNFGQEFAYPKRQATVIARAAQQPVPTVYSESPQDPDSRVGVTSPSGVESEPDQQTYSPPAPVRAPDPPARAEPPLLAQAQPEPRPEPMQQQPASELPATGSPAPLIGLMGMILLGSGLAIRAYSTRRS